MGAVSIATAVIALAIAGVLAWKRKMPKATALLTLIAGAGITGGTAGRLLHQGLAWSSDMVGSLTSAAFGTAVPSVLAVVALVVYVHDMWPKHKANHSTAVVGLVLPLLVTALGGAAGSLAAQAIDMVGAAAGQAFHALLGSG
ncbi:MAG: hypothetical protein ACRDN9_14360 [Streptosporangiaceae bacterium]